MLLFINDWGMNGIHARTYTISTRNDSMFIIALQEVVSRAMCIPGAWGTRLISPDVIVISHLSWS